MKRKASVTGDLGLGGYGSDEEEEDEEQASGSEDGLAAGPRRQGLDDGPGDLLARYSSRTSAGGSDDDEDREGAAVAAEEGIASERDGIEDDSEGGGQEGRSGSDVAANPLMRLPPELREPLSTTCSTHLQDKFTHFLSKMRSAGTNINDALRNRPDFRNPDFLQSLVQHFNVNQYGSAFAPEVFSPEGVSDEDTIEALVRSLEREQERRARMREQQLAAGQAPRIEFARGTGHLGHLPASGSASNLAAQQAAAAAAHAAVAKVIGTRR